DADPPPVRRSLYFRHSRDDQHPFLVMFDDADILRCYRRPETVVPQQALALANSRVSLAAARDIAAAISAEGGSGNADGGDGPPLSDEAFAIAAFETVLGVLPNSDELSLCLEAMSEMRESLDDVPREEAHQRACQNL